MPIGIEARWRAGIPMLLVAITALASSATSLGNGYAYDDVRAIQENERLHTLDDPVRFFTQTYWPPGKFTGGSTLYRPVTSLTFALQWAAGGGRPWLFHTVNVAVYLGLCLVMLWLASLILPPLAALGVGVLYAAHPVHVEAIGNTVGQAELWVNLFCLMAAGIFLQGRDGAGLSGSRRLAIYLLYALACLTKDNGLMLPGLLLAAELTVVHDPRPLRVRFRTLLSFWVLLALVGILYVALRTRVTGSLAGDYPHILIGTATYPERLFTMLRVSLAWARLLLWPVHLQADYSPRDFDRAMSFGLGQAVGLAMLCGLVWLALWAWRRRPVVTFGLFWFAVAIFPVSNLVLKAGIVLAERTLFLPSAGVMLALGVVLAAMLERAAWQRRSAVVVTAALAVLGTWRSALRQPVWRDTGTLFAQTVRDAPHNYRAHWTYALYLFQHGNRESAFTELATAIALFPADATLFSDAGDLYRTDGQCERAIEYYQRALFIVSDMKYTRSRLASCFMRVGRFPEARAELRRLVADGYPEFASFVAAVDSAEAAAASRPH